MATLFDNNKPNNKNDKNNNNPHGGVNNKNLDAGAAGAAPRKPSSLLAANSIFSRSFQGSAPQYPISSEPQAKS